MAELVINDEKGARSAFLSKKAQQTEYQSKTDTKKMNETKSRLEELENLMQSVYEDKVMRKIPEHICVNLLQKYESEQQTLKSKLSALEEKLSAERRDKADVEEFIQRLKKYFDIKKLTREICIELIEYITVSEKTDDKPRNINIYYKFLDKPLAGKRMLVDAKNA